MIGALFCSLADEGVLALEDPVAAHLPAFANRKDKTGPILLEHLLSGSTGLWLEGPGKGQPEPPTAQAFVDLLAVAAPLLPPGMLTVHSSMDRIVLLQVAGQVLRRSPYEEILRRFSRPNGTLAIRPAVGQLSGCYSHIYGTLSDLAGFLDRARATSWLNAAAGGIMRPITQSSKVHGVVPVAEGLGLFRQANGLLGQDGDHPSLGFCGMRVSADGSEAVFGHFRSPSEREHILTCLICDFTGTPPPAKSCPLGHLNGFDPVELTGTYRGTWGIRMLAEYAQGQLLLSGSRELASVPADIRDDGTLTGRWAAPNLWIEPQDLGHESLIGLRYSKHLYVKDRDDQQLYD